MNAPLESLFAWLLDFLGLATALLVAAIVLRWVLRNPASRVTLAWGTWLAMLAGGILLALPSWPRIDVADWLAPPVEQPSVLLADDSAGSQYVYLSQESLAPVVLPLADSNAVLSAPALSPEELGARIWLLVAGLAIGWLAIGFVRAWRLIARSQAAPPWTQEELQQIVGRRRRHLPGLLTSKQIASALALGTLRPRIVLPLASAGENNAPAVRAALAHEWAHIAAGDLWLLALERSLLPLLALHPLFWWLRRLTRLDQELAADAAAAGDKPAEYAEALLVWAKGEPHRRTGVAALAMWERPSNLSRRIHMILDPKRQASARRGRTSVVVVLSLLFTLAVGLSLVSWRPMSAQDQPQPQQTILLPATITAKTLPAPPAEQPAIMIEMQLLSLDRATGAAAVTVIKAARPANVAEEGTASGLVWAELNSAESQQLVQSLQAVRSTQVTAHPKLVTLNGQEATIEVGSEVPIVAVDETVNGDHRERHIEFKGVGTRFRIKPQILAEDPRMLALEIVGEHSTLLPQQKEAADPTVVPVVKSQKIDLKATVELGKTLILLSDAPEMRVVRGGPDKKEPATNLLIVLRPSVVEHKYVEVYPDPRAATRATDARTRYTQLVAEGADEAKLAEQFRSIRQAVEELAREREAARQENAALRAELEQLKSRWQSANQKLSDDARYVPLIGVAKPRKVAGVTLVFQFPSAGEAADAAKAAGADGKLEKLGAAISVSNNLVTITGPEAAVAELSRNLADKGKVLTESKHDFAVEWVPATAAAPSKGTSTEAVISADPKVPQATLAKAIEWLRANQADSQSTAENKAESPSDRERRTHRKLLELDLQAAELELQAAQEDFEAAEQLSKKNAISAEELRNKRRLVDRTRIQLAKLKVMLEAEEEPAAPAGTLQKK
jgi:beta-lactamase regulating signal transducer with metallopeptidase domain